MSSDPYADDTDQLVARTLAGDQHAFSKLDGRYRDRLRCMVDNKLDPKLASRLDPSDIVQEVFVEATMRLQEFLDGKDVSFYVWLRNLATDRMIDAYRFHIRSKRRSVNREHRQVNKYLDDSMRQLVDKLCASGISPSQYVIQAEAKEKMLECLKALSFKHREILVMRFMEFMSPKEIASILKIAPNTVSVRQYQALKELRELMDNERSDS